MLVIGVGNPDRGDDAAGWLVARALSDRCDTMCSAGDPAGLIEGWRGRTRVVLVDAVRSGAEPGTVTVVDLIRERLPVAAIASSHGLGPVQAVELGAAIGVLPASLTLVAIEGSRFHHGEPPTPPVRHGVENAIATIEAWLEPAGGSTEMGEVPQTGGGRRR